jgi:hypothetical protein
MVASFVVSVMSVLALVGLPLTERVMEQTVYTWIASGDFVVDLTLRLDPLAAVMILVVTGIGALIHIYSTAYMHEEVDSEFARYFSYLNLFAAFMLVLVLGANFVVMFVGWEGVGLCSYLLIGFWYEKKSASNAAMKAFIRSGPHAPAMRKLLHWCDEASVVHWMQDSPELPSWEEAYRRMVCDGRPSSIEANPSLRSSRSVAERYDHAIRMLAVGSRRNSTGRKHARTVVWRRAMKILRRGVVGSQPGRPHVTHALKCQICRIDGLTLLHRFIRICGIRAGAERIVDAPLTLIEIAFAMLAEGRRVTGSIEDVSKPQIVVLDEDPIGHFEVEVGVRGVRRRQAVQDHVSLITAVTCPGPSEWQDAVRIRRAIKDRNVAR